MVNFIDPDGGEIQARYNWDEDFQRRILSLILHDKVFFIQCYSLIKPEYFTNEAHQLTCKVAFKYFEKYNRLPEKFFLVQEIKSFTQDKPDNIKLYYIGETKAIFDYYVPSLESRDALRDKVANFAKIQAIKVAFQKCLSLIQDFSDSDDTWTKVYDILLATTTVDARFDIGLEYFLDYRARYERAKQKIEIMDYFSTSIPTMDNNATGGGPCRGELFAVMGTPGSGKSLYLVTMSIANVNKGKKVLYLSTEMNQDKIAERFDAQFVAWKEGVTANTLLMNESIVFDTLDEMTKGFGDDKHRLIVKQFPSGTLDIPTLRAYHQQLKITGFTPDMVIVDYIGEMKDYPNMPLHESREKLVKGIRNFACEEDVFAAIALQPHRQGREAQKFTEMDDDNMGDSYGQTRPLDYLVTINQHNKEKDIGVGRFFVAKARSGPSRYKFYVDYNKESLKITEITKREYDERIKKYIAEEKKYAGDVALDDQADEIARMVRSTTTKKIKA